MMESGTNVLVIGSPDESNMRQVLSFIQQSGLSCIVERDIDLAIQLAQDTKFHVIVMDTKMKGMRPERAVRILKGLDPQVRVIVKTSCNSKQLEARIRKEKVYYYHLDCFGVEELKMAVQSALKGSRDLQTPTEEVAEMERTPKILIVDDDPDFREATRAILESKKSYDIEEASNKNEAMDKINESRPDLILLDIMMERLDDGFTICYKLKHDPELKKIPILAISAVTEKTGFKFSPKTDGEYFEADDYVEKPIKPADLLQRVEELLAR